MAKPLIEQILKSIKNLFLKHDDLFYHDNEVLIIDRRSYAGMLTTGQTEIFFEIVTDKRLDNVNKFTLNTKCQIRHSDGGYIANSQLLSDVATLKTAEKTSKNSILFIYTLNQKSTLTNNTPLSIFLFSGTLKFNKEQKQKQAQSEEKEQE